MIAGIVAFLALVAYLGVAFATAHRAPTLAVAAGKPEEIGPWTARSSNLTRVRHAAGAGLAIRVSPMTAGLYGIEIKHLRLAPALRRAFALSVWLRSRHPGRLLVQVNTGSAPPIRYLLHTTVVVGRRWRRFSYHGRLEGRGTGLGLFIGQTTHTAAGRWLEVRDVSVRVSRR